MKKILSVLAVSALLASCGPPPDSVYDDGDQNDLDCRSDPFNGGPGLPGDYCSDAKLDCGITCCQACPRGDPGTSFWATECFRGRCDQDHACDDVCSARGEN